MKRVNVLPPEIVSKIAAGEVIERPASVIKELLENSFDAGANNISLLVKEAGKNLIHLKDNGHGISHEDIENIFLRHSTSKISSIDDLFAIKSFGFRGEALYSVAAISDITLRSKTKEQDTGWEIHMRGLEKISLKPVTMQTGTEIIIKELFFNTPARKKFLKRDSTEFSQILNVFLPYVILYPDSSFSLKHNQKNSIQQLQKHDPIQRIAKTLNINPENILNQTRELPTEELKVELFLGDMNIRRSRKDLQFIFINDRPVSHRNLGYALAQVYRNILPPGTYPFFCIKINIPPEEIDVNIHPSKREVKLRNDYTIVSAIAAWAKQLLLSESSTRKLDDIQSPTVNYEINRPTMHTRSSIGSSLFETYKTLNAEEQQDNLFSSVNSIQNVSLRRKLENAQYIGAFVKKYLLFEDNQSVLFIDQHAAHERINFEKLTHAYANNSVEIQRLLTPVQLSLSPQEKLFFDQNKEDIESAGFETTMWDEDTIAVHTHPNLIKNPETAVRNLIAGKTIGKNKDDIARKACRASIMTGDTLNRAEAVNLTKELLKCEDPFTCPHGRPTVIEIEEKTIARHFNRI